MFGDKSRIRGVCSEEFERLSIERILVYDKNSLNEAFLCFLGVDSVFGCVWIWVVFRGVFWGGLKFNSECEDGRASGLIGIGVWGIGEKYPLWYPICIPIIYVIGIPNNRSPISCPDRTRTFVRSAKNNCSCFLCFSLLKDSTLCFLVISSCSHVSMWGVHTYVIF